MEIIKKLLSITLPDVFGTRKSIIVVMITVIMSILLTFLLMNYITNRNLIAGIVERNYMETATKQFEFIDYWMERRVENIETISNAPAVIAATFQSNFQGAPSYNALNAINAYLSTIMLDQGVYTGIAVLDKRGRICYATSIQIGKTAADVLFKEIKDTDDIHTRRAILSTGDKSRSSCQPVSYPVYALPGERGAITGYVVALINMAFMADSLGMIDLGAGGAAYIADREGRVICSSGDFEYQNPEKGGYRLVDPASGKLITSIAHCVKTGRHGSGRDTGPPGRT